MSWLQVYELSVPHYEIRNGKYVFALQLQRYRANNNSSHHHATMEDWTGNVASYVTALQSYSQFRALWKELLRATKSTITTSSPLAHDGKAAFARRNRQTRSRLWSHNNSNQGEHTPTGGSGRNSLALASLSSTTTPLSNGACPCSNSCCPFTRLHWLLKCYPFPPKMVLKRNSQAVLEARRHALEQFVITIREFFTGFPRSFLHSVDSNERCRVLDIFSSFIGFSEELRSMAISRSPLLVAAWKADMLLNRDNQAAAGSSLVNNYTAEGSQSSGLAVGYIGEDEEEGEVYELEEEEDDEGYNNDVGSDEERGSGHGFRTPTVYIPSLRSLPEDALSTASRSRSTNSQDNFGDLAIRERSRDQDGDEETDEETEDDRDDGDASNAMAAAARKYSRSSVYIIGSSSLQLPRKTQPSLPKLQIRCAKVKTISSFLVDFRDHLLAQFGDILSEGVITSELSDARQWELGLYLACQIGQLYAVQSILSRGTDPNMVVSDGTTPLHVAARSGHNDVVGFLVANGADVNAMDKLGMTPLLLAINQGDIDLVKLLLDNGADVNLNNSRKVSAAHVAVACQSLAILKLLLEYDAFVNTANAINGKTPLHIAAETGNYHICELLLNNGANVHQRNDSGCDAYGLAVAQGHVNVAELCRAFQNHSQRLRASREQQLQQQQQILEITPLRQSILRTTMTMAASSVNESCGAHQSVKIVAQDGHSYAVL
ncbi:50S ribosomal protein l11 [Globisporangium polare]